MTKPDFIIIGAMKSATTTLHTQLSMQSGIFMTTPKEPNFFSDDEQYAKGKIWYENLFSNAEKGDLCGESSTHYTKLPDYPNVISRMSAQLKKPKFIYVMRHPIERLISHYIHQWSQNVIKCDINEAIDRYEELTAYSCYAHQLEPYFKKFGRDNVLPIFTEEMKLAPQEQLEKVARFIDYEQSVVWHNDLAPQNVSRDRIRRFRGYDWLVSSELMTKIRRGLIPKSVRDKIKSQLKMQEKPIIDEPHLQQLSIIFNDDLAKLHSWLDMELNCNNYHKLVTGRV